MCGIVGAFDLTGSRSFCRDRLRAMCAAIEHRGPDDEHVFLAPGIALGARRLSIVDLDAGRQPMCNEDGNIWVAFNGELFEYPELFLELQGRGHRLATRCDTEIWVHMYEDFGEKMFERVRGQFGVSLWDERERTLLLGRDRFGICPLYYTTQDGWLLWASEIKGLLASGMVPVEPDRKGINSVFTLGHASVTRTCFSGVRAIAPGHYFKIRGGDMRPVKYWDLDFPDAGNEIREDNSRQATDKLEALLRQSIKRRLRGDVPVATCLSGGIDSTIVTSLASQESAAPVPAFTISLDGAGHDEGEKAARSAGFIGSRLKTVRMKMRDIADAYPELIRAAETPVVDTSCACILRLAAAIRENGYKVALTGEGADEGLAGYPTFQMQKLHMMNGFAFARMFWKRGNWGILVSGPNGSRSRTQFEHPGGTRSVRQYTYELLSRGRENLYSTQMWDSIIDHNPYDELNLTNERMRRWHPLNQALYLDYHSVLQGVLVSTKADRVAMNSSVEVRPPFLDEDLVEYCAQLDPHLKLRRFREKWILRRVAERMLPRDIAWRRKWPFMANFGMTFLGEHRPDWVEQLLSEESIQATGHFDPDSIVQQRKLLVDGRLRRSKRVPLSLGFTNVVATQLWHHTFCGGGLCELPTWTPPTVAPQEASQSV